MVRPMNKRLCPLLVPVPTARDPQRPRRCALRLAHGLVNGALCALAALILATCGPAEGPGAAPQSQAHPLLAYAQCDAQEYDPGLPRGFAARHNRIKAVARTRHSIEDTVALPGTPLTLRPLFAYGSYDARLDAEDIAQHVFDCKDWQPSGKARTNTEGHASFALDTASLGVGQFGVAHHVLGDATVLRSSLYLLPPGTHFVVFDIDGTLTTHDSDLLRDLLYERMLHRTYHPFPYPHAAQATQIWRDKGYVVLYLTARPLTLRIMTDVWLRENGFAPGPLHMAKNRQDWLPTGGRSALYKAQYLQQLQAQGHHIDYAYGNAANDLVAYKQVGVPKVYQVQSEVHVPSPIREGVTTLAGYEQHLEDLEAIPDVQQPY